MRIISLFCLLFVYAFYSCTREQTCVDNEVISSKNINPSNYDSILAQTYGADDYGMKTYVMAFLYKGDQREKDSVKSEALQEAHLRNILRLSKEGKLILAGPFLAEGELRGLYLFDVRSLKEAEELTRTDPAIQSGHLRMELKEWYGSAACMSIPAEHKKLSKREIVE